MTNYERYTSKDGATLTMSQWGGSPAELELYRKLAELEDKIENGTLKFMPCKVGDTFWYISLANHIEKDKIANILLRDEMCLGERLVTKIYLRDLGKSWFLTKAEAETKLAELKEKKDD